MPLSDIEIARQARMRRITELAQERLGIGEEHLIPYGHYKAKLAMPYVQALADDPQRREGKLILVTAISPTPAGEGKTTTTVGLGDALNLIGKKAVMALREPSLGPVFGMKGGATGGGMAQVVPVSYTHLPDAGGWRAVQRDACRWRLGRAELRACRERPGHPEPGAGRPGPGPDGAALPRADTPCAAGKMCIRDSSGAIRDRGRRGGGVRSR